MWGRKEDQSNGAETLASASQASARPTESPPIPAPAPPKPAAPDPATLGARTSRIGQSIDFKGEIHSDEDILVDGSVDGSISVPNHCVVIGSESKVRATIEAQSVLIRGKVEGKISATEKVEISKTGQFKGDLIARRLEIHDGGVFVGNSAAHQPKPVPLPKKKAEAEPKPPAPSGKPASHASALQPAPTPEKRAEPKPPAAPAPLKPVPPNPVPAPAMPPRPLTKP